MFPTLLTGATLCLIFALLLVLSLTAATTLINLFLFEVLTLASLAGVALGGTLLINFIRRIS